MTDGDSLTVEVAYALPDAQWLITVTVPAGATAMEAVRRSGLVQRYPTLERLEHGIGIFGRPCGADQILRDGDRVEIYRPLLIHPRDRRRKRARAARQSR